MSALASSVSPWSFEGVSKETFGWSSIAWLTFTALAASGLGGYLAACAPSGRRSMAMKPISAIPRTASCRGRWPLLTAGLLTSAIGGVLGAGARWRAPPQALPHPRPVLPLRAPAALPLRLRKATSTTGSIRCSAAPPAQGRLLLQRRRRGTDGSECPRRRRHRAPVHSTRASPRRRARCRVMVRWATAAKCVPK